MSLGNGIRFRNGLVIVAALLACGSAWGQLRVVTWNISNYYTGRIADIQTAVYDVFEDRSLAPDVFLLQEIMTQSALNELVGALNTAPNSPGDWVGQFVAGDVGSEGNACCYRTSKIVYRGRYEVSGGGWPVPPRNPVCWKLWVSGYEPNTVVLYCYNSHMKAGNDADGRDKREVEAQWIRDDAEGLEPSFHFLLAGDLNVYTHTEAAYQELIGSQPNNDGRFYDPISRAASWHTNSTYAVVHTQDPVGGTAGGMDDRFDQVLLCEDLIDGSGLTYIGNPAIPYNLSTWNDSNHSYRSWGNDGYSYDTWLRTTGNEMVGEDIAQSLIDIATSGGHLPVFLDLSVPPKVGSEEIIDFGQVQQGEPAEALLHVWNDGDVDLWTADGITDLAYSLSADAGFWAPPGTYFRAAGASPAEHTLTMDTSTLGVKNGTLTIESDSPEEPSRIVLLTGEVVQWEPGDMNCDGQVDFGDINPFVQALSDPAGYAAQYPECNIMNGDINGDDDFDFGDINPFVALLTP